MTDTVITDDMIRRACNAYGNSSGGCEFDWMRAALTAAATPLHNNSRYTAAEKHKEALREVKQRHHVYPRSVANNNLTQALADRRIAIMEEIASDYEVLAKGERLI